jgi:hypothetical protein
MAYQRRFPPPEIAGGALAERGRSARIDRILATDGKDGAIVAVIIGLVENVGQHRVERCNFSSCD